MRLMKGTVTKRKSAKRTETKQKSAKTTKTERKTIITDIWNLIKSANL